MREHPACLRARQKTDFIFVCGQDEALHVLFTEREHWEMLIDYVKWRLAPYVSDGCTAPLPPPTPAASICVGALEPRARHRGVVRTPAV